VPLTVPLQVSPCLLLLVFVAVAFTAPFMLFATSCCYLPPLQGLFGNPEALAFREPAQKQPLYR
jgi:hypothetical protein